MSIFVEIIRHSGVYLHSSLRILGISAHLGGIRMTDEARRQMMRDRLTGELQMALNTIESMAKREG